MNKNQSVLDSLTGTEIAVVGMAGRFPGANNIATYWENLRDGVEAITFLSDEALREAGVEEKTLRHPHYVKAAAILEDMEQFDAAFFGFSPRDAAIMDPQHRHFLEVCWEALEHAGHDPARFDGAIGVYGGSGHNAYLPYNLLTNPDLLQSVGFFLLRHTGNDKDFLTTRVSYLMDLRGPSLNVQTACSTSLVAIHLACQNLLNLECDMALAGGVTIELPHRQGYIYQEGEILSPDGHCRPFDADSQGTVFGSGVGVVVLRRLDDAIKAGDTIHAVIKGSAINNDGSGKMNYLAPGLEGQAKAIAEALTIADVPADSVSYVETHGTGTPIGDPIEVEALTQAFRASSKRTGYCGLGSVKSNIGHLDTAAGAASFIKVVQALKHRQLPPSLHFNRPNPLLNLENSPFYVNARLQAWPTNQGQPRRAGVSSLGVGGTNAHIILEEAPELEASSASRPQQLLLLSAKSQTALDGNSQRLAHHLRQHPEQPLSDVAYTTQLGRQPFRYRRVVVGGCHEEIAAALETPDRQRVFSQQTSQNKPAIAFFFPGGGAQYPNMGHDLYTHEPLYRQIIDEGLALLRGQLDFDLGELLFQVSSFKSQVSSDPSPVSSDPSPVSSDPSPVSSDQSLNLSVSQSPVSALSPQPSALNRPSAALPALFLTEYALARLWLSWGIEPAVMLGHSLGEYTAACLAGVFSFADALSIVTLRGKLFESLPAGGMLSVSLPENDLRPHLFGELDIAVINSPTACVVSGPLSDIEAMAQKLDQLGIECQTVPIDVAAHSPMLEPILAPFEQHLRRIRFNPPQKPYISNVTGTWVRPQDAVDPRYWVTHLRHTVRFADGVATALQTANLILLEVGPGKTLTSLARQHPDAPPGLVTLTSLRHGREVANDQAYLLTTLGRLWGHGTEPDWPALYGQETRHRVPLPTYAFDHQRYWIEPGKVTTTATAAPSQPRKQANQDDWFYRPTWVQKPLPAAAASKPLSWLIFMDNLGVGQRLVNQLRDAGHTVVVVTEERQFTVKSPHHYGLNPSFRPDILDLVDECAEQGCLPQRIVHLWGLTPDEPIFSRVEFYEKQRDNTFYNLLFLTQALSQANLSQPVHITQVSNGMQALPGEPLPYPEKAIALGLAQVIRKEFSDITCQSLDVILPPHRRFRGRDQTSLATLATQIQQSALVDDGEPVALWRGRERWVSRFEPTQVEAGVNRLRPRGVYLITGGLGGIGLVQARHLAQTYQARLILAGRTGLPPRDEWAKWLATRDPDNKISQQIRTVQELENLGAEVLVVAADVSNREQVRQLVAAAQERFGTIHGVIHAAGVLNDGLIQLKAAGDVAKVFSPKVRGTLVLDEALADVPLDFFVVFSSTSTLMGPVGQVDYVGANAFLDAFAQSKTTHTPIDSSSARQPYTFAINWGMWSEVGMAVAAAHTPSPYAPHDPRLSRPMKHPLLGRLISETDQETVYETTLTSAHWLLDEHRLKDGTALIPGTGYLEMAWAAQQPEMPRRPVEIRDLLFIAPLDVDNDGAKTVRLHLAKNSTGYHFTVASQSSFDGSWQEHAQAQVALLAAAAPPRQDLALILARCNRQEIQFAPGEQDTQQERFLRFGPRWKNLRQLHLGDQEALARLELATPFLDDLQQYPLHPALLDLATGVGLPLVPGYATGADFFVPLTYQKVRVHSALTGVVYSHLRYRPSAAANQETATFDVTLMDETGRVLVEVEGFTVRRVGEQQTLFTRQTKPSPLTPQPSALSTQHSPTLLDLALSDGIKPDEGAAAFARLLSAQAAPRTIVSSLPLAELLAYSPHRQPDAAAETRHFARPTHLGDYTGPENETQRQLAELWQKVLGLEKVGIHDDFFDLGGDSLMAIRLINQVKKTFAVELSLATIFQAPTVAQMVALLPEKQGERGEDAAADQSATRRQWRQSAHTALVPIQAKGNKPPFFCVHGAGGHVLVYSPLADYLGLEQPFYGLQAVGAEGKQKPLTRIEEMAEVYLQGVRQVQPHGPYYLGGFSMGGEVAFEMAHRLKMAGEEVALLVLFDTFNPARNIRGAGIVASEDYAVHQPPEVKQVGRIAASRRKVMGHVRRLRQMGLTEQVRYVWDDARRRFYRLHLEWAFQRAHRTGSPMSYAFLEDYLWETNLKAITNYQPPIYPGSFILFRSTESLPHNPLNHPLGWGPLARDGVQEFIIDGPHRIMDEPYITDVARILQKCLAEAQAQYSETVSSEK